MPTKVQLDKLTARVDALAARVDGLVPKPNQSMVMIDPRPGETQDQAWERHCCERPEDRDAHIVLVIV
jgi:hypothetical protein